MRAETSNFPSCFDHTWLLGHLREYASARGKINTMLKKGELVRVKKGLYIPGKKFHKDYSRGVLANLIYGPSYVSFEYALSWYGMIPERVYTVTSACAKRHKIFNTPVGNFEYIKVPSRGYAEGIGFAMEAGSRFLVASREKAVADLLAAASPLETMADLEAYLYDNRRMEYNDIRTLDHTHFSAIAPLYRKRNLYLFTDYLAMRVRHE
jgi:hypothetical protein